VRGATGSGGLSHLATPRILEHVVLRLTVLVHIRIAGEVHPGQYLLQWGLHLGRNAHVTYFDQVGFGGGAVGIG